ncbi:MAG: copper chaperone PCu(A)C [Jatrophihabitantaceae bacterium]
MNRRPPLSLLAAALVVLLGLAGLIRGALPQSSAGAASQPGTSNADVVVGGAYVREPANGINAAAYFTVYNTTDKADTLVSVTSGAGAQTSLHTDSADGSMQDAPAGGLTIPAHGSLSLTPGKGHAMIEKLYGTLKAGQSVNLQFTFGVAGQVLVTAPVIGVSAPAPTAGAPK